MGELTSGRAVFRGDNDTDDAQLGAIGKCLGRCIICSEEQDDTTTTVVECEINPGNL